MSDSVMVFDRFYSGAKQLRAHFNQQFENPQHTTSSRFVWDYWHVPDQYTFVRTPMLNYFPRKILQPFLERLVFFGQEQFGCHAISPAWLSYYVEGCSQQFHADIPHGPWAFVYSLTLWKQRTFKGGETFLLQPEVLSYWDQIHRLKGLEQEGILQFVEPQFNRLTVFDPRIPHGVREVRGVSDPREGRLVIHGWFVEPKPFIVGPLKVSQASRHIDDLLAGLSQQLGGYGLHGTLTLRCRIAADGRVQGIADLTNTLVGPGVDKRVHEDIRKQIRRRIKAIQFPKASSGSQLTLPLLFR